MSLTLTSALVGIIITSEDPRQPSKLISGSLRVDRFFPPWVVNKAVGAGSSLGGSSPRRGCVRPGSQTEWCRPFPGETDLHEPTCSYTGWLCSLGPGLALTVGRAHLGCSECPQSSLRAMGLLGDALGSPPPGKLQLLPGIIITWIITRFRACWRILGWCQSAEAGFRDCGRLPLLGAETKRKRVTIQLPKDPTWQGPGFGKRKAERGRKLMSSLFLCSACLRQGSPGFEPKPPCAPPPGHALPLAPAC